MSAWRKASTSARSCSTWPESAGRNAPKRNASSAALAFVPCEPIFPESRPVKRPILKCEGVWSRQTPSKAPGIVPSEPDGLLHDHEIELPCPVLEHQQPGRAATLRRRVANDSVGAAGRDPWRLGPAAPVGAQNIVHLGRCHDPVLEHLPGGFAVEVKLLSAVAVSHGTSKLRPAFHGRPPAARTGRLYSGPGFSGLPDPRYGGCPGTAGACHA